MSFLSISKVPLAYLNHYITGDFTEEALGKSSDRDRYRIVSSTARKSDELRTKFEDHCS